MRSVNQGGESGGGRGLCCVEQHVDWEGHGVREGEAGSLLRVFAVNNPHKRREEEVGQPGERALELLLLLLPPPLPPEEFKTPFDYNESPRFTSV